MRSPYAIAMIVLLSCNDPTLKSDQVEAKSFSDKATEIFVGNLDSRDSINKAIAYIDSAIIADPTNISFYFNKAEIYKYLKENDTVIRILSKISELEPNNFRLFYTKGEISRNMNLNDSSVYNFKAALLLIENDNSPLIIKDYLKIKLNYYIGDTVFAKKLKDEFYERYENQSGILNYKIDLEKNIK